MKRRVRAPTAAVPALLPPSEVGGLRGRVGMAVTQTSFHVSASELKSSQFSTDHGRSPHKAEGTQDSIASTD